jgi:FkbM family methyltransferase
MNFRRSLKIFVSRLSPARIAREAHKAAQSGFARAMRTLGLVPPSSLAEAKLRELLARIENYIFETKSPQAAVTTAFNLLMAGSSATEAMNALVRRDVALAGSRHFRALAPSLAPLRRLPPNLADALERRLSKFQIIDVGSQALEFEEDIYAPLARAWPCEIVGFDPFTPSTEARGVEVVRPDGGRVRTIESLIGDGGRSSFYVNRMAATSSTLPANHSLTRQFGRLDDCLKVVECRELQTRRLDDLLDEGALFEGDIDLLKIDVQGTTHTVLSHAAKTLDKTLVLHVEVEFAEVYLNEPQCAAIDQLLRARGFGFIDFYSLGRMPYAALETSEDQVFYPGRLLWGDAIYLYGIDDGTLLTGDKLLRAAVIMHEIYNKQDLAAELFSRYDKANSTDFAARYLDSK